MSILSTGRLLFVVAAMSLAAGATAQAADPLVSVDWVTANTSKPGIVMVDLRGREDFLRGHVPGAVHSNYGKDGWREARDGVPDLFPADTAKLAAHIGGLGIDNATHVVLMPPGANSSDMGMGTRIYWTFKVLGHDEVSILDGGMTAYLAPADKDGNPTNALERGAGKAEAKTFTVNLRPEMLAGADDVKAMAARGALLVDNRTADQYMGVNRHGKAKASGTIAGAVNLPQSWMTENGGGKFRSRDQLAKLFDAAGVPTEGEQVSFCNTGHWASIGWFAASEIMGNKDVKLYDGSMTEWTIKGNETEAKINLN
ncbi:MAG: rhodanese-like domain-containing protein [Rhodospirillaceae bacterium]